jgi:hypothetical protein
MPTKHERIGVVKDDELRAALDSVAPLLETTPSTATLVHVLAVRGAQALREDAVQRAELLRELAEWSTGAEPPWDPTVLARVDELTQP